MLACLDVHYRDPAATAACVVLRDWSDSQPAEELVARLDAVAPYEPGAFFKRELPCLLAVLKLVRTPLAAVIVDGYVDLAHGRPGLGRHLHDSIGTPVIGVAKASFAGATHAIEVVRGRSKKPLFVTAAGLDPQVAADHVRAMSGEHRIPSTLQRVDALCRTA